MKWDLLQFIAIKAMTNIQFNFMFEDEFSLTRGELMDTKKIQQAIGRPIRVEEENLEIGFD